MPVRVVGVSPIEYEPAGTLSGPPEPSGQYTASPPQANGAGVIEFCKQ